MAIPSHPSSGQNYKPSASRDREINQMLAWYRSRNTGAGSASASGTARDAGTMPCIYLGASGNSAAAFTPVTAYYASNAVLPDQNPDWYANPVINVSGPGVTAGARGIGFLQAPAQHNDLVSVRFAGVTLARLKVQKAAHRAALIDTGNSGKSLISSYAGDYKIIHADFSGAMIGEYQNALIEMAPHNPVMIGKADSNINAAASGTVSLWRGTTGIDLADTGDNVTAWLDWAEGGEKVSAGKEVWIRWFSEEQIWRIIGAECEA